MRGSISSYSYTTTYNNLNIKIITIKLGKTSFKSPAYKKIPNFKLNKFQTFKIFSN